MAELRQCTTCTAWKPAVWAGECGACRTWRRAHGGAPRPVPAGYYRNVSKRGIYYFARNRSTMPAHTGAAACRCRRCVAGRLWHPPAGAARQPGMKWNQWSPSQDTRLRALIGTMPVSMIAETLTAEFGIPRTRHAVKTRACGLGLSTAGEGYTLQQIAYAFGCSGPLVHSWLTRGWLAGHQVTPRRRSWWCISEATVERFIRTHIYAYDWRRMRPGRWRNLAELEWRRDPWWRVTALVPMLGIAPVTVRKLIRDGHLQAHRGAGFSVVRRSAILAWQKARAAA